MDSNPDLLMIYLFNLIENFQSVIFPVMAISGMVWGFLSMLSPIEPIDTSRVRTFLKIVFLAGLALYFIVPGPGWIKAAKHCYITARKG